MPGRLDAGRYSTQLLSTQELPLDTHLREPPGPSAPAVIAPAAPGHRRAGAPRAGEEDEAQFSVEIPLGSRTSHAPSTACTPASSGTNTTRRTRTSTTHRPRDHAELQVNSFY